MPNLTLICDYQKTKEVTNMTITINAQGAERKRLVQTVSDWLGVPAKYCGAPTFNYRSKN